MIHPQPAATPAESLHAAFARADVLGGRRAGLLAAADLALLGMHVLPGTGNKPHFVGDPPDWFADPVGNPEYTWTLNRLEHWPVLLAAWMASGDRRYADRVALELRDWLDRVKCPTIDPQQMLGQFNDDNAVGRARTLASNLRRWPVAYRAAQQVNSTVRQVRKTLRGPRRARVEPSVGRAAYNTRPWRTLEVGHRMAHALPLIARHLDDLVPDETAVHDAFRTVVEQHGEVLATMPGLIWPDADHNHYLMECLGLLHAAAAFPELPQSGGWLAQAMSELERCAAAQFTEDGGHIEACPHYHNVSAYLLAEAFRVARATGMQFSDRAQATLARSLDHCVQTLRPDGTGVPVGDSDADQLAVHATLVGYLATGDAGPLRAVARLTGLDAVRDVLVHRFASVDDPAHILAVCAAPGRTHAPTLAHQRQLGQVTMRSGWGRDAIGLLFHCRTPVHNGHTHADPASFDLTACGRPLLVDPGRYTYVDNDDRRAVRSAAWHNTLTIDGREPFTYLTSMQWGPQQPGEIAGVHRGVGVLAAESRHENYRPAVHRRLVAIVDGSVVVVLDRVAGLKPRSRVQLNYHVAGESVEASESNGIRADVADVGLDLVVAASHGDALSIERSAAFHAPSLDERVPSTRVRFEDAAGPAERAFATVIVPRPLAEGRPMIANVSIVADGRTARCTFDLDGRPLSLEWTHADGEHAGDVRLDTASSDAVDDVVYC